MSWRSSYTDRARAIIRLAREGADEDVGIAQVLVAILSEETRGVARHVLDQHNVQPEVVRSLIAIVHPACGYELRSIKQLAEAEARALGHMYIGSEHLLLACLKLAAASPYGDAIQKSIPMDYECTRDAILNLLGQEGVPTIPIPPELHWVAAVPHRYGRFAILPPPHAGEQLPEVLAFWQAFGVDVLVSLLGEDEIVSLGLQREASFCEKLGLTFISYPIVHGDVPKPVYRFLALVNRLDDHIGDGCGVAVHCRADLVRSCLLGACLLAKFGLSVHDAFASLKHDCGVDVPITERQRKWVRSLRSRLEKGRVGDD